LESLASIHCLEEEPPPTPLLPEQSLESEHRCEEPPPPLEFIVESVVIVKGVANRAKVSQLDAGQGPEVPVVSEFSNVFPEELPGMPPDRDIEFMIELMSGTTPIYKSPYRMATPKLAELKEHIKELLEK
jgi:hypothetical protein